MKFEKNDIVTVTIEDMSSEGEGIGKADGFALFVKDAVVGDVVEARIVKSKKNYAYARLEKVIEPSPFRVEPKCAFHRQCGGCQLQALSYERQLQFKQEKICNNLIRIGGFESSFIEEHMEPIVGMEIPFFYRNKAQYPVGTDREGNVITGFYAGRTHSIIPNTDCCLGVAENKEILEVILEYMREKHVSAYDETTGEGLVRHILIRKGFTSGEIMVCLIINWKKGTGKSREFLPGQQILLNRLAKIQGMTSVSVSINRERTNVIMGKEIHTLWGSDTISDTIHVRNMEKEGYPFTGRELTFHISPLSFYQVNPVQTEKLYSLALEFAGLTGKETVWDLYCGIGTISLFLARSAKKVYGVEIIPQAIEDARENAKRNGIENAEFFVGKAEEVLPEFYETRTIFHDESKTSNTAESSLRKTEASKTEASKTEASKEEVSKAESSRAEVSKEESSRAEVSKEETLKTESSKTETSKADVSKWRGSESEVKSKNVEADMLHPDVIVVDPPRKGCDEACIATMLKMQSKRIVYVSCDSATLARDLRLLCDGGYEIQRIRGVDQFGMTVHCEVAVLMTYRED